MEGFVASGCSSQPGLCTTVRWGCFVATSCHPSYRCADVSRILNANVHRRCLCLHSHFPDFQTCLFACHLHFSTCADSPVVASKTGKQAFSSACSRAFHLYFMPPTIEDTNRLQVRACYVHTILFPKNLMSCVELAVLTPMHVSIVPSWSR